jgi:hypothetical protein
MAASISASQASASPQSTSALVPIPPKMLKKEQKKACLDLFREKFILNRQYIGNKEREIQGYAGFLQRKLYNCTEAALAQLRKEFEEKKAAYSIENEILGLIIGDFEKDQIPQPDVRKKVLEILDAKRKACEEEIEKVDLSVAKHAVNAKKIEANLAKLPQKQILLKGLKKVEEAARSEFASLGNELSRLNAQRAGFVKECEEYTTKEANYKKEAGNGKDPKSLAFAKAARQQKRLKDEGEDQIKKIDVRTNKLSARYDAAAVSYQSAIEECQLLEKEIEEILKENAGLKAENNFVGDMSGRKQELAKRIQRYSHAIMYLNTLPERVAKVAEVAALASTIPLASASGEVPDGPSTDWQKLTLGPKKSWECARTPYGDQLGTHLKGSILPYSHIPTVTRAGNGNPTLMPKKDLALKRHHTAASSSASAAASAAGDPALEKEEERLSAMRLPFAAKVPSDFPEGSLHKLFATNGDFSQKEIESVLPAKGSESRKATLNAVVKGFKPLQVLIAMGTVQQITDFILKHGNDLEMKSDISKNLKLLGQNIKLKDEEVESIQTLIEVLRNGDVGCVNASHALHIASSNGISNLTIALTNVGADPMNLDANGFAPIHYVVARGDAGLFKLSVSNPEFFENWKRLYTAAGKSVWNIAEKLYGRDSNIYKALDIAYTSKPKADDRFNIIQHNKPLTKRLRLKK